MAARDIQFVIKAQDQASRAFDSIAQALQQLTDAQAQMANGATAVNADLNVIVQTLAKFDAVSRTVSQGSESAEAAFKRQTAAVAELRAQLNALDEQRIASVRAQGSLTGAAAATGGTADPAKIKAIEAAQVQLEGQIAKVTVQFQRQLQVLTALGAKQTNMTALADAVQKIAPNVTATQEQLQAVQAIAGFAKQIGDQVAIEAAAREKAAAALRAQAAAAREEVVARETQAGLNAGLGVTPAVSGAAAASAAVFQQQIAAAEVVAGLAKQIGDQAQREVAARERAAALLHQQAVDAQDEVAAAQARAKFDEMLGVRANPNGAQAAQSAAVFTQAANEEERLAAAAAKYQGLIDPTLAAQKQFNLQLKEAQELRQKGLLTEEQFLKVQQLLTGQQRLATKGKQDEILLLSSAGIALQTNARAITETMVLAREASRDNFSRMAGSFTILLNALGLMKTSFLVPFAGMAVAIGGVVVAMMAMADEAERLRTLNAILRENADGADYNAKAIAANVDQLRAYRIAADDAMAAVRTFIKEGLNPQDFVAFGQAAKDSFRVNPEQFKDVKDAAKQLAQAFTGGYDAVAKLDDATNFLSVHERQQIRDMFDAGKASEARTRAFNDYRDAMHGAAGDMDSSLTPAANRLADAWAHLGETLNDSKFGEGLKGTLDDFITGLDGIATLIEGKGKQYSMIQLGFKIQEAQTMQQDPGLQAALKADPTLKTQNGAAAQDYKQVLADIARLKKEIADYDKQSAAATAPSKTVDPAIAQAKARQQAVADAQKGLDQQTQLDNATTSFDRIRVAGEQAYQKEMEKSGNAEVARIERLKAEQKIRTEIERTAVGTFTRNIVGAEGGGAQNPHSSAVGDGQFTSARWLEEFTKALPAMAASLTRQQILDKRTDPDTAKAVLEQQARDLAESLKNLKLTVSATNLYLAHFLGPAGAAKVLNANPSTPVDQLGLGTPVLSGNQGYLRTDNGKGRYRTAGELQTFIAGRIGDTTDDQYGAERQALADLEKKQNEFNRAIDEEAKKRQIAIKYLQQEQGATVDAKYAAERQKAIDEAVQSASAKAQKAGTVLSPDQKKDIETATGAVYDLEHAEKLVNDRLTEQQALRDALLKGITEAEQAGDTSTVAALTAALNDTDSAFSSAIDAAERYWKQFDSPEARAALQHLRELRRTIADTGAELAKAHLDAINQRIGGATALQSGLAKDVDTQQLLGNNEGAKRSERDLAAVNIQLVQLRQNAIDAAIAMLSMTDAQLAGINQTRAGLEAFILEQKQAQQESVLMGRQFLQTGKQINEMLADELVSGMDNFLTMVAQGKNVFRSLATAAAQTAANVLKSIGEMMLKQALFNALSAHSQSGGGGIGGSISAAAGKLFPASVSLKIAGSTVQTAGTTMISASQQWNITAANIQAAAAALAASGQGGGGGGTLGGMGGFSGLLGSLLGGSSGLFSAGALAGVGGDTFAAAGGLDFSSLLAFAHGGGIAGLSTMSRTGVSPSVLANAISYHTGGVAGLQPNEVPTILEKGEEILTRGDPRHRNNAGKGSGSGGGSDAGLKQVLVFHPADIASALASSEGRKVVLTHIQSNRREIKTMLS